MKKSLQKFPSKIKGAKTSRNIRATNLIFDLLNTQSEVVYPLKDGNKGPKKSAARFMLMASKEKLLNLGKFDSEYINQLFKCISL